MSGYLIIAIYIISMILIILDFAKDVSPRTKKRIFIIFCIALVIIAASKTQNTCNDAANYIRSFNAYPATMNKGLVKKWYEPGFVLTVIILKKIGLNYSALFGVIGVIAIVSYARIILMYSQCKFLSLFTYITCFFFLNEMIIIRHGLSTALIFANTENIAKKQWKRAVLYVVLAGMFHVVGYVGIIPVIIAFFRNGDEIGYIMKLIPIAIIICLISLIISMQSIVLKIADIIPILAFRIKKGMKFFRGSSGSLKRLVLYIPYCFFSLFSILPNYKSVLVKETDEIEIDIVSIYYLLCGISSIIVFHRYAEFGRIGMVYLTITILMCSSFVVRQNENRSRVVMVFLFVFLSSYIFFRQLFFNSGAGINYYF